MLDYPAMRAVALVAQTGSFEKAAQVLCVTPSAVSQRIKQLEERLGVVLIVRGNPCVATEKGEWLCRHMDHVGMLESELFRQLPALAETGAAAERVTLNIATNADSLGTWFLDAVSRFTGGSDYLVNIAVDDQDHTVEWLRAGGVLAPVPAPAKPVQGCRVTPLGVLRYPATASPDFMARHFADGVTPVTLARAPGLTFNQKDRLQASWIREALGEDVSYPTHWLPSTDGFVKASLAGMGWGLNPVQLVGEHLEAGGLGEGVPGAPLDIPLYWQVNRLAAERLGALTSHMVETARAVLLR
ncbi:LysR family transcriptional regulator ArgP [Agrobacterium radiobacter]|uniref:LysR family transcriptional regulator ArgP n=1 Tax=Agrobacterium radiobacter TaxID=362 RepID=UPI0007612D7E|nr:LysR family transcriptional regulator ArgP [Agrobacterium radiobacter]KWT80039.1 LysR family transcriptional regulator [Agrobacterium radiobacter]